MVLNNDFDSYHIETADELQDDLDAFLYYLLVEKMSIQAAEALLKDYDETVRALGKVAESLKVLDDPIFAEKGYRKIRLRRHNYYLVYAVDGNDVMIYRMFHDLQDLDGALKD